MRITEESPEKPVNYWHTRLSLSLAGLGVLAFSFSLSLFILSFRTVSNYESEPESLYMPRQIVYVMGNYYYRHRDVYDRVAESFWTEYDHENYKYILRSDTGDVGKAFPYLDATLSHYFEDYADVLYKDSVFIIGPRYNRNADSVGVVYVHSYKTDSELLSYFDSYLFYDNQMDAGRGKWLYRLDDYWCVCSPAREGVLKEMKYE